MPYYRPCHYACGCSAQSFWCSPMQQLTAHTCGRGRASTSKWATRTSGRRPNSHEGKCTSKLDIRVLYMACTWLHALLLNIVPLDDLRGLYTRRSIDIEVLPLFIRTGRRWMVEFVVLDRVFLHIKVQFPCSGVCLISILVRFVSPRLTCAPVRGSAVVNVQQSTNQGPLVHASLA